MALRIPFHIDDPTTHTMGSHLYEYLLIKMHHRVIEHEFDRIVVVGRYDRSIEISQREKSGKRFNWQRPTAEVDKGELTICCPPGLNYVLHYASLVKSFLALSGRRHNHVYYVEPTEALCKGLIDNSNVSRLRPYRKIVFGYGLESLDEDQNWIGDGTFQQSSAASLGRETCLIGCKHSVWGDIGGRVVAGFARELGASLVVFIGKLGVIDPVVTPNEHLATGNVSSLNGRDLCWENVFDAAESPLLRKGTHFTSSSTIKETVSWLREVRDYSFVDPEIGHMAQAALNAKITFSYLHIVSNNLSRLTSEDLSNERNETVLVKRKRLVGEIGRILRSTLSSH